MNLLLKRLLLPLITALLTTACSESNNWYAEVTEWITGLPMDNTCELAAPMWVVPAEYGKSSPLKTPLDQFAESFASRTTLEPYAQALPMLPTMRSYLLLYSDPALDTARKLPQGTRVELLSVWLEKMTHPDLAPLYAVCAELRPVESSETFWIILACKATPTTLAPLTDPTTGAPLTLSLEDALHYPRKRTFSR